MYVSPAAPSPKPRIDLGGKFVATGSADGYVLYFNVINDGDAPAVDISYYLTADDLGAEPMAPQSVSHNLSPGQTSTGLVTVRLNGTEFYTKKLNNPRIIFIYRDRNRNEFRGGRHMVQEPRADQNFNIATNPGDYFEV
jgi:hypothetical protein